MSYIIIDLGLRMKSTGLQEQKSFSYLRGITIAEARTPGREINAKNLPSL
jgi:hypothetical protein